MKKLGFSIIAIFLFLALTRAAPDSRPLPAKSWTANAPTWAGTQR